MILHLARIAPLLAALACWRVSRPSTLALLAAFFASLAWLLTHYEPLRWVSAIVGLVGAIEFGRGARDALGPLRRDYYRSKRRESVYRAALHGGCVPPPTSGIRLPRHAWIGLLLLASMAGDGAALLAFRALQEWALPVAQIVVCVAIALVARWPERSS